MKFACTIQPNMCALAIHGSYRGIPRIIHLDPSKAGSVIATQFALQHHIPRTITQTLGVLNSTASGPIPLPIPSRWYSIGLPLPIEYLRTYDIEIGADVMQLARVRAQGHILCDPIPIDSLLFGNGISFVRSPVSSITGAL